MIQLSLFLDLPQTAIKPIEITQHTITLSLTLETSEAACPLCEHLSQRVHSRYQRTLQDLPCGGKVLRLHVQVRGFFCTNEQCRRKIFAERFPELTSVYTRRTTRCTQALIANFDLLRLRVLHHRMCA